MPAGTLGGEIGQIDRQRLVADGVRRVVFEEMHALDERIAGHHKLVAFGDHEDGGIVAQTKRAGLRG